MTTADKENREEGICFGTEAQILRVFTPESSRRSSSREDRGGIWQKCILDLKNAWDDTARTVLH